MSRARKVCLKIPSILRVEGDRVISAVLLARAGAKHRKRSGDQQPSEKAGRSKGYVFGLWGGIAVLSGLAALLGYVALEDAPDELVAFITSVAAGGILAMLADTMIPEAFEEHHNLTGLTAAVGFLTAFTVHHLG